MKYINELSYSSHVVQTKQLAKDKKQKNKYRQTTPIIDDERSEEAEKLIDDLNLIRKENDRRKGGDRRKAQENRGRYVESRLTKNRRYEKELSLVI